MIFKRMMKLMFYKFAQKIILLICLLKPVDLLTKALPATTFEKIGEQDWDAKT